ncbi:hypothetical protein WJ69_34160 [Burkholderia ubonensis]|uniref:chaperone SicP n=1 Tax=Burkholderia ubonensis TaxID=101571 RepID=UPI00075C0E8B|nr:chaperone SicP [Burkholderia ubonensis]KVN98503.1 hypothetical protein WJ69_34160 [Burkholderia ubonensis]
MNKNTNLLTAFGRTIGIDLEFDEHGQSFLLMDEQLMVSIRSVSGAVILYAMVGEFPDAPGNDFWQKVLAVNVALAEDGAGALAFEERTEALLFVKHLPTERLEPHDFADAVESFVNRLESLIATLDAMSV